MPLAQGPQPVQAATLVVILEELHKACRWGIRQVSRPFPTLPHGKAQAEQGPLTLTLVHGEGQELVPELLVHETVGPEAESGVREGVGSSGVPTVPVQAPPTESLGATPGHLPCQHDSRQERRHVMMENPPAFDPVSGSCCHSCPLSPQDWCSGTESGLRWEETNPVPASQRAMAPLTFSGSPTAPAPAPRSWGQALALALAHREPLLMRMLSRMVRVQ